RASAFRPFRLPANTPRLSSFTAAPSRRRKLSPRGCTARSDASWRFRPARANATRGGTAPAPTSRITRSCSRFCPPRRSSACSSPARSSSSPNRARRRSSCTIRKPSTTPFVARRRDEPRRVQAGARARSQCDRRVRRRDGHDALQQGRIHQSVLRRAQRPRARARARSAHAVRRRRRRRDRDEQLRRQPREAREIFRQQMAGLVDGGVDLLILETFSDLDEIEQAILAARDADPSKPLIAQMTIGADCLTPYGASPDAVARALDAWGADVIGVNCSVGPQTILECIEKMAPHTRRKLSAQPNAGMPRDVGGRSMYMASPEYMATYARHLVQAGAKIVGGCCGTTPDHIHAMVEGIRPLAPRLAARQPSAVVERGAAATIHDPRS